MDPACKYYKGSGCLTRVVIRDANYGSVLDFGMAVKQILELGWSYGMSPYLDHSIQLIELFVAVGKTYLYHLLDPVVDCNESFVVDRAKVTGLEEATF